MGYRAGDFEETMREAIEIAYETFVLAGSGTRRGSKILAKAATPVTNSMARSAHQRDPRKRTARVVSILPVEFGWAHLMNLQVRSASAGSEPELLDAAGVSCCMTCEGYDNEWRNYAKNASCASRSSQGTLRDC